MVQNSEMEIFKDFLKLMDLKFSRPRETILRLFLEGKDHIDIDKLAQKARECDPFISRSTVYRTMNLLVGCGLAHEINFSGERKFYESTTMKKHHDHFFCTQCKYVGEFQDSKIEDLQNEVAKGHKFKITSHRMILYGLCSKCK